MCFFLMHYENQFDKISSNVELMFKFAKIDKCQNLRKIIRLNMNEYFLEPRLSDVIPHLLSNFAT